jgi:hypothetical protein
MAGWKEVLPASEACTLLTGRETLQSTRYKYLANWKAFPAGEDVPRQPVKGRVSEDTRPWLRMRLSPEKAAGYPDATGPALACYVLGDIKYKKSTIRNQSIIQKYFSSPMGP